MNEPLVLEEWPEVGWAVLRPNPEGKYLIGFYEVEICTRLGDLVAACPTKEAAVAALRLLS